MQLLNRKYSFYILFGLLICIIIATNIQIDDTNRNSNFLILLHIIENTNLEKITSN